MSTEIKHIVVEQFNADKPYCTAVVAGNLVFVSGQIPPGTSDPREIDSLDFQVRSVILRVGVVLEAAGSSLNSIVKTTCYLISADDFPEFNEIYRDAFGAPFPARTTIIAKLAARGALFEMDAIAVLDEAATS